MDCTCNCNCSECSNASCCEKFKHMNSREKDSPKTKVRYPMMNNDPNTMPMMYNENYCEYMKNYCKCMAHYHKAQAYQFECMKYMKKMMKK